MDSRDLQWTTGTWQPVADDIWVMACEPAGVNIGLVVGSEHVLLVDAGSSPEHGRAIAESARELVGRPVDRVVITHGHWDHFHGLAGIPDAESYGHEQLLADLEQARSQPGTPAGLVPPSQPFSLVHALDLGGLRVELLHFGPAHTQGDVLVQVPARRVWFTGDLLETSGDPQVGPESTIEKWPMALDGILGGADETSVFVPGHGPVATHLQVFEQRAHISTLYGSAEALVNRGVRLEQALEAIDTPTLPDGSPHPGASEWEWYFSPDTVKAALPLLYAELAGHGQVPRTKLPLITP
ncbi:MBL fold metallo-hydrolase [Propionibacteriaceae bacterium Y1923]